MADVFDQISSGTQGDVFDQVAKPQGDVFDQVQPQEAAPLTPAQDAEARQSGHLAVAPSVPIPAWLEDYLVRTGRRLSEGQNAFYNLPENLKNVVTGGGAGRVDAALRALQGVTYPIAAPIMAGVEAPVEQAVAGFGASPNVAEQAGNLSSLPLAVLMGRASNAGKLGTAGEDIAKYLLGVSNEQPSAANVHAPSEVPLSDVVRETSPRLPNQPTGLDEASLLEQLLKTQEQPTYAKPNWVPDITTPSAEDNIYSRAVQGRNRFHEEAAAEAMAQGKPYMGTYAGYDMAPDVVRNQPIYDRLINMKQEFDPEQLVDSSIRNNQIQKTISEATGERSTPGGANPIYPGNAPKFPGTREVERVLTNPTANDLGIVKNPLVERTSIKQGAKLVGMPTEGMALADQPIKLPSRIGTFLRTLGQNANDMVARFGPAGQELARRINRAMFDSDTMATGWWHGPAGVLDMAEKLKLSDAERANVTDVLEGLAKPQSENVRTMVNLVRPQLEHISQMAQAQGLEIRNLITGEVRPWMPRENFVPHYTNLDQYIANPAARVEAISRIQQEASQAGKTLDRAQAENILEQMRKHSRHEYGHLEVARTFGQAEYEKDFLNWYKRYTKGVADRLSEVNQFGRDYSVADNLINAVGVQTKSDWYQSLAKQLFDRQFGREALGGTMRGVQYFNDVAMPLQVMSKLSHAVIANYTQRFYPAFMGGYANLAKAWRQAIGEQGQEFGRLAGASIEHTMRDIYEMSSQGPSSSRMAEIARTAGGKVLELTGFAKVEVMNRMIAANYGKVWANDMIGKLPGATGRYADTLKRNLAKLGIDNPMEVIARGGQLTPEQEIAAGRKMVELTQFKTQVKDLPLSWTNPLGRLLSQFSSFAFRSGKFTYDQILKEARHGNLTPLTTFVLSGGALGEGVADIKSWIGDRDRPQNLGARMAENLAYIGALGIWYDALQSSAYGETGIDRRLLGPTLSDAAIFASGLHDPKTLAKQLTQNIPIVGPYIRPRLFPAKPKALQ